MKLCTAKDSSNTECLFGKAARKIFIGSLHVIDYLFSFGEDNAVGDYGVFQVAPRWGSLPDKYVYVLLFVVLEVI